MEKDSVNLREDVLRTINIASQVGFKDFFYLQMSDFLASAIHSLVRHFYLYLIENTIYLLKGDEI